MSEFSPSPRAGVDYPQTWGQFEDWFATEADCVRYLVYRLGLSGHGFATQAASLRVAA
ncbi:MAG: hypothetical protein VB143_09120 [Burkholderia sp.]